MILAASDYAWFLDLAIWSAVVFVILVAILAKFAGKPIVTAMDARQQNTVETLSQAEIAKERVHEIKRQQELQRVQSREHAVALIAEAERDAKRLKEEILARIEAECAVHRGRVEKEIQLTSKRAVHRLWQTTTDLSTKAAVRVLETRLDDQDHRRLVDEALGEIATAAEGATS